MPSSMLLDYGVAINFFGNYRGEAAYMERMSNGIHHSLLSLQNLLIGGTFTAAIYKLASALMHVATEMETNFAAIKATVGSVPATLEAMQWARKKGVETPLTIDEVNKGLAMLYTEGMADTKAEREKAFNAIASFQALRGAQHGIDFNRMAVEVAAAGNGNWRSMKMLYGVEAHSIGEKVNRKLEMNPEALKEMKATREEVDSWIKSIKTATAGTHEYRQAVIGLIGILGAGGMSEKMKTIQGVMSNLEDVYQNFMYDVMGFTQVQGTFANMIKESLTKVYDTLNRKHEVTINGVKTTVTYLEQMGRIARGVGDLLKGVWEIVTNSFTGMGQQALTWIDNMAEYFSDYKKNIAPMILFLALVKIEVVNFFSAFYDGFKKGFLPFWNAAIFVWKAVMALANVFGFTHAKFLGLVAGLLIGVRVFNMMTNPLIFMRGLLLTVLTGLGKLITAFLSLGRAVMAFNWSNFWGSMLSGIMSATKALGAYVLQLIFANDAQKALNLSVAAFDTLSMMTGIGLVIAAIGTVAAMWSKVSDNTDKATKSAQMYQTYLKTKDDKNANMWRELLAEEEVMRRAHRPVGFGPDWFRNTGPGAVPLMDLEKGDRIRRLMDEWNNNPQKYKGTDMTDVKMYLYRHANLEEYRKDHGESLFGPFEKFISEFQLQNPWILQEPNMGRDEKVAPPPKEPTINPTLQNIPSNNRSAIPAPPPAAQEGDHSSTIGEDRNNPMNFYGDIHVSGVNDLDALIREIRNKTQRGGLVG